MAKKKVYAVKKGKQTGLFYSWNECKESVSGYPGAEYKGFETEEEAKNYLENRIQEIKKVDIEENTTNQLVVYVDGSFDEKIGKYAFGCIILTPRGETIRESGNGNEPDSLAIRNVAGEMLGAMYAVQWAIKNGYHNLELRYDYEGIEKWATGEWRPKKELTKKYVSFIIDKKQVIEIEFIKVPAHSGVELNEEVDTLAKNALLAKGYKTYNDGSVYFVGYGLEDWKTIIECINEENRNLFEKEIAEITYNVENIGTRNKISIFQSQSKVVINCYSNSKSYVQGKQTVLFQKIIVTAIELLQTGQKVVETLNSYHALTITKVEVENKFEQYLPHYRNESDKHYSNLLSAVYNTMLTGYMPDYTCLVTPIFRAYEFFLHRILGDVMELETENDKGNNKFSYFSKNDVGKYVCNSRAVVKLNAKQSDYLNRLYTQYNSVRHPYSHWSASDLDTAVITDCESARAIIMDGLELGDEYYTLF